jgi:hypothetical protein
MRMVYKLKNMTRSFGSLRWLCMLSALFLAAFPAFADNRAADASRVIGCHDERDSAGQSALPESVWFPVQEPFQPLLADPKQPRFFIEYQRVSFDTFAVPAQGRAREINAAFVGLGGDFGLWARRIPGGCNGMQVNVFGGAFSAFNLDTRSANLINTDFVGGIAVMWREDNFAARLRLLHQSSHLGDELLLTNPMVNRVNLSFEEIEALVSFERGRWRFYGGGGYLAGENGAAELDPWKLQWGIEFRGASQSIAGLQMRPVLGADFKTFQTQDWELNSSLAGGLEWSNPYTDRRVRLLLTYIRGFSPYGQFFATEEVRNVGLEMQFEL